MPYSRSPSAVSLTHRNQSVPCSLITQVQQQIWTVSLSQPMQPSQLMQPQVLLSQPAQQTHLVSVAQSQPLSQGCSSVTDDDRVASAQRRRCVEDMWSPSITVNSEVNQSVNRAPRATDNSLDDAAAAIRAAMQVIKEHHWLMPSCHEATRSVIGEESLMMVLPIKQEEEPLQTVPGVMQLVPSKRKRRQRPRSYTTLQATHRQRLG